MHIERDRERVMFLDLTDRTYERDFCNYTVIDSRLCQVIFCCIQYCLFKSNSSSLCILWLWSVEMKKRNIIAKKGGTKIKCCLWNYVAVVISTLISLPHTHTHLHKCKWDELNDIVQIFLVLFIQSHNRPMVHVIRFFS